MSKRFTIFASTYEVLISTKFQHDWANIAEHVLCNSQFRDVYSDFTKKKSKTQYFLLLVYIFLKNCVITCFHFLRNNDTLVVSVHVLMKTYVFSCFNIFCGMHTLVFFVHVLMNYVLFML